MTPKILVVGSARDLWSGSSRLFRDGVRLEVVATPDETEGRGVDIVVIDQPFAEEALKQVRVHPSLHDKPVVVVGTSTSVADHNTWTVDTRGVEGLNDLTNRLSWLVARANFAAA